MPRDLTNGGEIHKHEPQFMKAVQEGWDAAEDGRTHAYAEVRYWLLGWGTASETEFPLS